MELSHQTERGGSALDALEHELYNPKNKMDESSFHRVRDRRELELPTSWGDNAPLITQGREDKGFSFGAKMLFISFILLLSALGYTAWKFFSLNNVVSAANIDMSLEVIPYVEGGEAIPVTFTLLNRNTSPLQEAVITLEYKKGVGSQDEQEKVHEKREIGLINPNDNKRQDFNVILYGSEAEQRDLTIKLEYKVTGSGNIFSKIITASTVLKTPQVSVHIDGPNILSIGQNGTFDITVKNNSATTTLASILQVILPNTFTVNTIEPRSLSHSSVWSIRPLAQGESQVVTITGSLSGIQGETASMKALIGSEGDSNTSVGIVYSSQTIDIKLRSSPLNFALALDTESGGSEKLRYGDRSILTITYANTSDKTLQDISVELLLSGQAPLYKNIELTSGYYDSLKRTILWDKKSVPALATLAPGATGSFRIIIPIVQGGTNSPSLKVTLSGSGTVESKDDVVSIISKSWVVEGSATINVKTTFKNSPFVSTGPIPPEPNVETAYTAHILVSAQNSLINTQVSFRLPTYVSWRNISSDISKTSFDENTRTATWSIGNLAANTTQVMDISLLVKPSQSHVGQMPNITSGIVLDADEEVSRAHIRTTLSPITTYIAGENWEGNPSIVVDK